MLRWLIHAVCYAVGAALYFSNALKRKTVARVWWDNNLFDRWLHTSEVTDPDSVFDDVFLTSFERRVYEHRQWYRTVLQLFVVLLCTTVVIISWQLQQQSCHFGPWESVDYIGCIFNDSVLASAFTFLSCFVFLVLITFRLVLRSSVLHLQFLEEAIQALHIGDYQRVIHILSKKKMKHSFRKLLAASHFKFGEERLIHRDFTTARESFRMASFLDSNSLLYTLYIEIVEEDELFSSLCVDGILIERNSNYPKPVSIRFNMSGITAFDNRNFLYVFSTSKQVACLPWSDTMHLDFNEDMSSLVLDHGVFHLILSIPSTETSLSLSHLDSFVRRQITYLYPSYPGKYLRTKFEEQQHNYSSSATTFVQCLQHLIANLNRQLTQLTNKHDILSDKGSYTQAKQIDKSRQHVSTEVSKLSDYLISITSTIDERNSFIPSAPDLEISPDISPHIFPDMDFSDYVRSDFEFDDDVCDVTSDDNDEKVGNIDDADMSSDCVVCMDAHSCVAVVPCGHVCFCKECAGLDGILHGNCPVCRQPIQTLLPVYMP